MHNHQRPFPVNPVDNRELFDVEFPVASTMECTGLIPAMTPDVTNVRSYSQIYDIPLADFPDYEAHMSQADPDRRKKKK